LLCRVHPSQAPAVDLWVCLLLSNWRYGWRSWLGLLVGDCCSLLWQLRDRLLLRLWLLLLLLAGSNLWHLCCLLQCWRLRSGGRLLRQLLLGLNGLQCWGLCQRRLLCCRGLLRL
jgi:hypothetical protein